MEQIVYTTYVGKVSLISYKKNSKPYINEQGHAKESLMNEYIPQNVKVKHSTTRTLK